MAKEEPYTLTYVAAVSDHLQAIEPRYHGLIRQVIDQQLTFDAEVETANRKPLHEPILSATWELRCGPKNRFRVFYDVDSQDRTVVVFAIGEKRRERLWVAGKVFRP